LSYIIQRKFHPLILLVTKVIPDLLKVLSAPILATDSVHAVNRNNMRRNEKVEVPYRLVGVFEGTSYQIERVRWSGSDRGLVFVIVAVEFL
jgi:vancomycin permeability regulator SanA